MRLVPLPPVVTPRRLRWGPFGAASRLSGRLRGGEAPAPAEPPVAGFLPAWGGLRPSGHAALLCIACSPLFRGAERLTRCAALRGVLAPRAMAALLTDRFDAALAAALAWQRERAAHAGWRPCA